MKVYKQRNSILLVILHVFLAIGAIGGGILMIISPNGELMGLPLILLDNAPFKSYLIPGLILFFVLGMLPLFTAVALIKRWDCKLAEKLNLYKDKHWSWTFSLYIGFMLIICIIVQVLIIQTLTSLHFIYITLGIIIQIVTLLPMTQREYSE